MEQVQGAKLQGFAELVDEPRWYKIPEEDAVDMLRKRMTNYGTKAKKLWMRQNAQAVIAEHQKLVRQQEGRVTSQFNWRRQNPVASLCLGRSPPST